MDGERKGTAQQHYERYLSLVRDLIDDIGRGKGRGAGALHDEVAEYKKRRFQTYWVLIKRKGDSWSSPGTSISRKGRGLSRNDISGVNGGPFDSCQRL